ncbi:MAG: CehA/McbA family metallohydrolase [Betaproteobacteria bacterium]|jgi:predicted metal-dependent phosphoesterase TrpH
MQIRADLHVHSTYSKDSLITPKELIYYSRKNGLNAVAVTDHDKLEGAYRIAKETDFLIIPGMEVSSSEGHIVALNIKDPIPKGLTARETVERIHGAGGVAIACHPFVRFKGCLRDRVCESFDAIEVINARAVPFSKSVKLAQKTAERFNLSRVAGTDAHYGPQIGYGYTVVDAEDTSVEAICRAIVAGRCQPFGKAVPPQLNFELTLGRLMRIVTKKPPHLT